MYIVVQRPALQKKKRSSCKPIFPEASSGSNGHMLAYYELDSKRFIRPQDVEATKDGRSEREISTFGTNTAGMLAIDKQPRALLFCEVGLCMTSYLHKVINSVPAK